MDMDTTPHVVLIEDNASDITKAIAVLKSLNVQDALVFTSVSQAVFYFEDVTAGVKPCPDLIILDLDFGGESGFEILRLRKASRVLLQCEVLVWTIMGDTQKELCRLFGLSHVVSKHDGEAALKSELETCLRQKSQRTANQPDRSKMHNHPNINSENAKR
jgi:DNA-binding response OmpR family regulator